MFRPTSLRRSGTVLAMSLAMTLATTLGFAGTASATHSWNNYHWARTTASFTLQLPYNFADPQWTTRLSAASTDWSLSAVLDTSPAPGTANPRTCRASSGRVQVCSAKYGSNGWLGLAQIWLSGSHIVQGVTKMNDTYFAMAAYNNTSERQHVMCQEVGHTFGLDHQSTNGDSVGTCMDYYQNTSNSDTQSTQPNQHDYDELALIYKHLDTTTTVGSTVATSGSRAPSSLDDPRGWGRLVERSPAGTDRVYVRDFGNSEQVVTFVTGVR